MVSSCKIEPKNYVLLVVIFLPIAYFYLPTFIHHQFSTNIPLNVINSGKREWPSLISFWKKKNITTTADPISASIQLFIKALRSETILSNKTYERYRNDSIRYFGQEQYRMDMLLSSIFQGKQTNLNILITGGSVSSSKVFEFF